MRGLIHALHTATESVADLGRYVCATRIVRDHRDPRGSHIEISSTVGIPRTGWRLPQHVLTPLSAARDTNACRHLVVLAPTQVYVPLLGA
jgi:hypothetical protein